MTDIRVGKAISYATLPGIWPRVRSLFFSGFGPLAYFVALTYAMVRLLPQNHPYLDPRNAGQYGVRHVIAAAMNDLRFEWKYIDQILVFFAILAGVGGLMLFVIGILAFVVVSPVFAMDMIITQYPETDIAFMMLDRVFGIAGIFNSDVSTSGIAGAFPNFFHVGLQGLFQFFSMGLFLLSVFVFLYHVIVIVAETSLTGTPFGHRFDNIWIPIRIIAALGLLMPAFAGLNAAQYIVLYAAKYGSGLATNGWITYNLRAGDNPMGMTNDEIIARPAMPDYTKLIKDLLVVRGCAEMYVQDLVGNNFWGVTEHLINGTDHQWLLPTPTGWTNAPPRSPLVNVSVSGLPFNATYDGYGGTFIPALNFYDGGDIKIVMGTYDPVKYPDMPGNVMPYCGEIVIPITSHTPEALYVAEGYMAAIVRILYSIRRSTATGPLNPYEVSMTIATARDYFQTSTAWSNYIRTLAVAPNKDCGWDGNSDYIDEFPRNGTVLNMLGDCRGPVPTAVWIEVLNRYQAAFEWGAIAGYDYLTGAVAGEDMEYSIGDVSYTSLGHTNPLLMDLDILRYGWGGAGLWYNKIAEKNGSLMAAVGAAPYVSRYPLYMEKIKESRLKNDKKVEQTGCEAYNPSKATGFSLSSADESSQFPAEAAKALYKLCDSIHMNESIELKVDDGAGNLVPRTRSTKQPNPILNIINALFGAGTFFNILENTQVHPMTMLTTLGRTLIDKAIFNLAAATGSSIIGGINQLTMGQGDPGFLYVTVGMYQLSSAFIAFGTIALVAGATLYYVIPFLPFMYFFFAVGRWVKTIFEAMVGVPLWALAHLSFKGPGLPGSAASSGYFLILEIFIRPILTVFSLIAAFAVFGAMVAILNAIFSIAVSNIFGADVKITGATVNPTVRGLVDQFFLTVVYVIVVYVTGTSAFKLIDLIPDNIMRWSGAGVRTWGGSDIADDLVDNTGQYVAMSTYTTFSQVGKAITSLSEPFAAQAERAIQQGQKKMSPAEEEAARQMQQIRNAATQSAPPAAAAPAAPGAGGRPDVSPSGNPSASAQKAGSQNPATALAPGSRQGAGGRPDVTQSGNPAGSPNRAPGTGNPGQSGTGRPATPQGPGNTTPPGGKPPRGTGGGGGRGG